MLGRTRRFESDDESDRHDVGGGLRGRRGCAPGLGNPRLAERFAGESGRRQRRLPSPCAGPRQSADHRLAVAVGRQRNPAWFAPRQPDRSSADRSQRGVAGDGAVDQRLGASGYRAGLVLDDHRALTIGNRPDDERVPGVLRLHCGQHRREPGPDRRHRHDKRGRLRGGFAREPVRHRKPGPGGRSDRWGVGESGRHGSVGHRMPVRSRRFGLAARRSTRQLHEQQRPRRQRRSESRQFSEHGRAILPLHRSAHTAIQIPESAHGGRVRIQPVPASSASPGSPGERDRQRTAERQARTDYVDQRGRDPGVAEPHAVHRVALAQAGRDWKRRRLDRGYARHRRAGRRGPDLDRGSGLRLAARDLRPGGGQDRRAESLQRRDQREGSADRLLRHPGGRKGRGVSEVHGSAAGLPAVWTHAGLEPGAGRRLGARRQPPLLHPDGFRFQQLLHVPSATEKFPQPTDPRGLAARGLHRFRTDPGAQGGGRTTDQRERVESAGRHDVRSVGRGRAGRRGQHPGPGDQRPVPGSEPVGDPGDGAWYRERRDSGCRTRPDLGQRHTVGRGPGPERGRGPGGRAGRPGRCALPSGQREYGEPVLPTAW